MEKIEVKIYWADKNYNACCDSVGGTVVDSHKDLEALKASFTDLFKFHLSGLIDDGDPISSDLANGNYELIFTLDVSAVLHALDGIISRSALARVTGINERQLSHYMSGHRKPRDDKKRQIIDGIHTIGQICLSFD